MGYKVSRVHKRSHIRTSEEGAVGDVLGRCCEAVREK